MLPSKLATFWATWKLKLLVGVAVLAALAILVISAHYVGYNKGKNLSEVEIQRYEKILAEKQTEYITRVVKGDQVVITNYRDVVRYQDRIVYQNRDVIKEVVVERPPEEQSVSDGWVYAHNQSALSQLIDPTRAAASAPSGIGDKTILLKVTDNYNKANSCIAKLESLQALVKERERILNEDK